MKFFGMGGFELVIILIVILLIFGPKNLPKLGSALGKTVSNLRSGMNDGKKKKGKEADDATADDASDSKPVEIEGEVETVETVEATEEPEGVEGSEEPAAAPGAEGDSATEGDVAPKKVRRVVKKKVTPEE